jgi:hypothetical protein
VKTFKKASVDKNIVEKPTWAKKGLRPIFKLILKGQAILPKHYLDTVSN